MISSSSNSIKGIDFHCWPLTCSECMNDTANRKGSRKEEIVENIDYPKQGTSSF
ncbi:MAG: hypothetical protein Q4P10_00700 [Methanomassiliicoccales archaeon]|nr:hypothetical protein [Methanomassiliicoccales archaeon]